MEDKDKEIERLRRLVRAQLIAGDKQDEIWREVVAKILVTGLASELAPRTGKPDEIKAFMDKHIQALMNKYFISEL